MTVARFILATSLVLAAGPALATPPGATPTNASTRTFSNVTAAILACMTDKSRKEHGTVYKTDPNNPNAGTSETHYYGLTILAYAFDPAAGTVTYTILHKPGFAANSQVWNGIGKAIKGCS